MLHVTSFLHVWAFAPKALGATTAKITKTEKITKPI